MAQVQSAGREAYDTLLPPRRAGGTLDPDFPSRLHAGIAWQHGIGPASWMLGFPSAGTRNPGAFAPPQNRTC